MATDETSGKFAFKGGSRKRNIRTRAPSDFTKQSETESSDFSSVVKVPKMSKQTKFSLGARTQSFPKVFKNKKIMKQL